MTPLLALGFFLFYGGVGALAWLANKRD